MKVTLKDIEYVLKKLLPEKYLLEKRLKRSIKNNYENELNVINKFSDNKKEAIDVGVYRGVYSYKLSKQFKFVHAFEPNPIIFPYLYKYLIKMIKNIRLYNIALSNKSGQVNLRVPNRGKSFFVDNAEEIYKLGCATIHKENHFSNYESFRVKEEKLDNLIKSENLGFIKIDVEGHEIEVIKGGINLIKKNKPVLLVEIEKRHTKKNVKNTLNEINNLGYQSYFLKDKDLINTEKLNDHKLYNNYIFTPKN